MPLPAELLRRLVLAQAGDEAQWISDSLSQLSAEPSERDLYVFLGLAPRRLGKADLVLTESDRAEAQACRDGWCLDGWSIDGAARVLGLLVYARRRPFAELFKDLRRTADAGELIALYRGLPLYPEPESLYFELGEGLRTNTRPVFEAIAHHNPFPRDHFDQHRWNHMVLKALFIGSRLAPILGLDDRANPELARILHEYAHERWAAGRSVSPELWRCVGRFAENEADIADLAHALTLGGVQTRAAGLALAESPSPIAQSLLAECPEAEEIAASRLSWATFEAEEEAL
jgi:hypothetical protein